MVEPGGELMVTAIILTLIAFRQYSNFDLAAMFDLE